MFVTVGDDVLGQGLGETGDPVEQGDRSGVHIHPDRVYAILDHGIESAGQHALADIVLVLTHTYALGIDLDQLSQRILKTACDGDGAAQ